VYRPQRLRNLRNDALYREGRTLLSATGKLVRDWRALHAIQQGTEVGKALAHSSWVAHEVAAMEAFFAAGLDVPRVVARRPNAILMDYIGDDEVPAPTLHQVSPTPSQARQWLERCLWNVEGMLRLGWVHGDLSAFNVLVHEGRLTLIDFPQVVRPQENRSAEALFRRDVTRICGYFARHGVAVEADELAGTLWARYVPDDVWLAEGEIV
jgi:RIO kinase 1